VSEDATGPAGAGQGMEVRGQARTSGELRVAALGAFSTLLEATHTSVPPALAGLSAEYAAGPLACSVLWSI
jgi:hypothetical protein